MATLLPRTLLALCLLLTACQKEKTPPAKNTRAERIQLLLNQGNEQRRNFANTDALAIYQQALALCGKSKDAHLWSDIAKQIAFTHQSLGDPESAVALYREILAQNNKHFGKTSPESADTADNLAHLLWLRGDYVAVETLLRRMVALNESAFRRKHYPEAGIGRCAHQLTSSLTSLGTFLEQSKPLKEVEPLIRRALKVEIGYHAKTKKMDASLYDAMDKYQSTLVKMGDTAEQAQEKIDAMMHSVAKR